MMTNQTTSLLLLLAVSLNAHSEEGEKESIPFEISPSPIVQLAVEPSFNTAAYLLDGRRGVYLYSITEKRRTHVFEGHKAEPCSIAISPDGKYLATGDVEKTLYLWNLSKKRKQRLDMNRQTIPVKLCFHPNSTELLVGGYDGSIQCWDIVASKPKLLIQGHDNRILDLAYSSSGKLIASSSSDKAVKIWNSSSGKEKRELQHTAEVIAVKFSSKGDELLTGDINGNLRRWNLKTKKVNHSINIKHSSLAFGAMEFSPDGKWCVTGEWWLGVAKDIDKQAKVTVWNIANGEKLAIFEGHTTKVRSLIFSSDSKRLISSGGFPWIRVEQFQPPHTKSSNR